MGKHDTQRLSDLPRPANDHPTQRLPELPATGRGTGRETPVEYWDDHSRSYTPPRNTGAHPLPGYGGDPTGYDPT